MLSCPEDPEEYNYDDTSINGAIAPEFTDEEGPEWDEMGDYPEEVEEDEDEEE